MVIVGAQSIQSNLDIEMNSVLVPRPVPDPWTRGSSGTSNLGC
jgi:hypothetical protein